MSILESIKEERKLSFNNWRYRLLHWCFNEDCDTPCESGLPRFLYTHYCPLFHLTNFIALLSPLILATKVVIAIVMGIGHVLDQIDWSFLKRKEVIHVKREITEDERRRDQWGHLFRVIANYHGNDFEQFWHKNSHNFSLLDESEVGVRFTTIMIRIEAARERAAARKKRMQDTIIFWVNFSRAFIKWLLYIAYAALGIFSLWLVSIAVMPIISAVTMFFTWMFNFDFMSLLPYLVFGGKIALVGGLVSSVLFAFHKFGFVQRCGQAAVDGTTACMPPFVLLAKVGAAPFKWGFNGICGAREFCVMFYEENCPPITIVSEDEEAFEESLEEHIA